MTILKNRLGVKAEICGLVVLVMTGLTGAAQFSGAAFASDELTDELVVTTTRSLSERQFNPGNIAVLNTDHLPSLYPSDLLNRAAGVLINRGSGQEHLSAIRSPVLTGGAGAGSFLFLQDGIPLRAAGFANVNALMESMQEDTARVEVIRGPGSALYGSNSVHGLVNLISKTPENPAYTQIEAGSYGHYRLTHAHNFAQNTGGNTNTRRNKSRLSLALSGDHEGYRDNSGYAQQKIKYQQAGKTGDTAYRFLLGAMNLNQETAGYATDYRDEIIARGNLDENAHRDARAIRASLRLSKTLANGDELVLTPYLRHSAMQFRMHFLADADPLEKNDHHSIGLLAAYHTAPREGVKITAGMDAEWTKGSLSQFQTNPAQFGYLPGLHYDYDVTASVLSPFIHSQWQIAARTKLIAGLRADSTHYDYRNNAPNGSFGRFFRNPDRKDNYLTAAPKFSVLHTFDNFTAYINLARGNRAPQTSDAYRLRTGQSVGDVKPETLDSVELGIRGTIGEIYYEFAAYRMNKRHYYFRDSNNENVANGKTSHTGIELDLNGALTDRLYLSAALAYGRHQYDFTHRPNKIMAGTDIDTAPRRLASITLDYALTASLSADLNLRHVGRYATNEANTQFYKGHSLADFGLIWQLSDTVEARATIKNIFDRAYATRADYAFGNARYFPGEARHWGFGVKRNF